MSETALCSAVVAKIETVLTAPTVKLRWIDVRPDGKPLSAITSDCYVSVWSAGWKPHGKPSNNNYIDENHGIGVTVSLKTHKDHIDYWGLRLNQDFNASMSYAVHKIIKVIHQNPAVLVAANAIINATPGTAAPFIEMLSLAGVSPKKERDAKWWGTTTTATSTRVNDVIGWSQEILFSGARRIQKMDTYT